MCSLLMRICDPSFDKYINRLKDTQSNASFKTNLLNNWLKLGIDIFDQLVLRPLLLFYFFYLVNGCLSISLMLCKTLYAYFTHHVINSKFCRSHQRKLRGNNNWAWGPQHQKLGEGGAGAKGGGVEGAGPLHKPDWPKKPLTQLITNGNLPKHQTRQR